MARPQESYLNCSEPLPQFYGEDRLVILPRDPHNIFAYWEVSPPTRNAIEECVGIEQQPEIIFLLRIYKHTRNNVKSEENYWDMEVGRESSDWYIPVAEAGCRYRAELGWQLPGGPFQSILRSNVVHTPRDSISDVIDENWQLLDWKARKLYQRISLHHLSSAEFWRGRKK